MKKIIKSRFFLICTAFALGLYWEQIDLLGKTEQRYLYGVTEYISNGMDFYVKGINPKTKQLIDQSFPMTSNTKIFYDVPSNQYAYATWKRNRIWWWNLEIHLHEDGE